MKKCPFCAEMIQPDAIKCKHCGEWISKISNSISSESISAENIILKVDVVDTDDFKEKCLLFSERRIVVAKLSEISGLSAFLGYPGIIINAHLAKKKNEKTKQLSLDDILLKNKNNFEILNKELTSIEFFYKERKGIAKWALQENKKIIIQTSARQYVFRFKSTDAEKFDSCITALKPILRERLISTNGS